MAGHILNRFEFEVLKDKSSTDKAQIPAEASITLYPPGVLCRESRNFPQLLDEPASISVEFGPDVREGDVLAVFHDGALSSYHLIVDTRGNLAAPASTLNVYNNGPISFATGDRLVVVGRPLVCYADPQGQDAGSTSITSDSGTGRAGAYLSELRADVLVSIQGLPLRLYPDWTLGGRRSVINARDFPTIQDAIDALPALGGTVFIPAGVYELTETLYTPCDRPCHLVGEGGGLAPSSNAEAVTLLKWTTPVAMLRVRGDYSSVQNLTLLNSYSGSGLPASEKEGYGISIGRRNMEDSHPAPGTSSGTEYAKGSSAPLHGCLIQDVAVDGALGWGLYIPGFGKQAFPVNGNMVDEENSVFAGTLSYWVDLKRVRVRASRKFGACFTGGGCAMVGIEGCAFLAEGGWQDGRRNYYAYVSKSVQVVFSRCTFEGFSPPGAGGGSAETPWVVVYGSEDTQFDTCWFEEDAHGEPDYTPTYFVRATYGCRGGMIRNCHFVRAGKNGGVLRCISLDSNSGVRGLVISEPYAVSTEHVRNGNGTYKDPAHVDLGGDNNDEVSVVGTGVLWDQSPLDGGCYPIQYANAPRTSNILGRLTNKLPGATDSEVDDETSRGLARVNGNVVLNPDIGVDGTQSQDPKVGAVMYWWGGAFSGWRLANNLPTLTTVQRARRDQWVQGDMIYNSSTERLEVLVGGVWKYVTLT